MSGDCAGASTLSHLCQRREVEPPSPSSTAGLACYQEECSAPRCPCNLLGEA